VTIDWIKLVVGVLGSPLAEQKLGDERRCAAAFAASKPSTSSQDEVGKGGCAWGNKKRVRVTRSKGLRLFPRELLK
jgi:hypothetical protein